MFKHDFTRKSQLFLNRFKSSKIFFNQKLHVTEKNERKSEQAHTPHAPTLLENAVYNEWQFQALVTGNRTKKGIQIAPQKDQISFSCKNAYLHIMSFITTKFHAILLS